MDREIETIEEAIAYLDSYMQAPFSFLIPLDTSLQQAEDILSFKASPAYRTFLEKVAESKLVVSDIVQQNEEAHDGETFCLPDFLVAFFNDGYGNQYCFDTRKYEEPGGHPIVFWKHELTFEENLSGLDKDEDSFEEWFIVLANCTKWQKPKWDPSCIVVLGIGGLFALLVLTLIIYGVVQAVRSCF